MEWLNDHLVTALIAGLVGSLITATSSDNKDGILRRSIDVFANTALSFYVGSFIAEVGELQAMYRPFVFFCCGMMGMFLKENKWPIHCLQFPDFSYKASYIKG